MLNAGMSPMGSMSQGGPAELLQMLQAGRQDPFARPMPGEGLMGPGGMSMPQPPGLPQSQDQMAPPQMPGMETISTDFANTQPGLPNLPDTFQGFGYGQFAPKEGQGMMGAGAGGGMRQQLIMQLMNQLLPQMQGGM